MPSSETGLIIYPIGDEDNETRNNADRLCKEIVMPVLKEFNYATRRADKINKSGMITPQIIEELIKSPLVIADLTEGNPNVFYELAVRHAMNKPCILMKKRYPLQISWVQSKTKYNISFIYPYSFLGIIMDLKALKQTLASLDINPDEIEDKRYATAFRILFAIIEKQNEEIEFLKAENQKLRDEINLLKGEQTKPNIRGSKRNDDISSEKERRKIKLP